MAQQTLKTNGPKAASSHLRQVMIVEVLSLVVGSRAGLIWVHRENHLFLQSPKRATGEVLLDPGQLLEIVHPVSVIYCRQTS